MQKKQTQAQTVQANHQLTKDIICSMLGYTESQYAEMQYACALSYLAYKMQFPTAENRIQRSKIFWAWWKNNWAIRDEVFIDTYAYLDVNSSGQLTETIMASSSEYLLTHNPYHLSSKLDKYGELLHQGWLQIIDLINEEHT